LLAVPITLLYDRGQTINHSLLLRQHLPSAYIALNPADAQGLNFAEGAQVQIPLDGASYSARLQTDEHVPPGIALVPRSLGIPIDSPVVVDVKPAI
jgi:anaerobic selenocysteine-containing dehydrogenase